MSDVANQILFAFVVIAGPVGVLLLFCCSCCLFCCCIFSVCFIIYLRCCAQKCLGCVGYPWCFDCDKICDPFWLFTCCGCLSCCCPCGQPKKKKNKKKLRRKIQDGNEEDGELINVHTPPSLNEYTKNVEEEDDLGFSGGEKEEEEEEEEGEGEGEENQQQSISTAPEEETKERAIEIDDDLIVDMHSEDRDRDYSSSEEVEKKSFLSNDDNEPPTPTGELVEKIDVEGGNEKVIKVNCRDEFDISGADDE